MYLCTFFLLCKYSRMNLVAADPTATSQGTAQAKSLQSQLWYDGCCNVSSTNAQHAEIPD